MAQIELNDWNRKGDKITMDYFHGDEELSETIDYDNLVEHASEEGMNRGSWWGTDESGESIGGDTIADAEAWTEDNLKEVMESYLEKLHKTN